MIPEPRHRPEEEGDRAAVLVLFPFDVFHRSLGICACKSSMVDFSWCWHGAVMYDWSDEDETLPGDVPVIDGVFLIEGVMNGS